MDRKHYNKEYRKNPRDNRTRMFRIRVTEDEYQTALDRAEEIGISISTLGRIAIKRYCENPDADLYRIMHKALDDYIRGEEEHGNE